MRKYLQHVIGVTLAEGIVVLVLAVAAAIVLLNLLVLLVLSDGALYGLALLALALCVTAVLFVLAYLLNGVGGGP
jgi:ABC-type multidrug transport system permease subunit